MADVEESAPVVPLWLVGVLPVGALAGREARAVVAEVVGEDLAEGVRRHELEAVPRALADARLERVVVAAGHRLRGRDVGDQGVVLVEGTPLLERGPGRGVARAGQRLVALDRGHQVGRVVADVAHVDRHGRGQQALDEHVPLLGELRPQVRVEGAHLPGRRLLRHQLGEAGGDRPRAGRLVVGDVRLEEDRRVHGQPQVGARALHVLGDAVAAADDPLPGRPPGEAEARLPPLVVGVVEGPIVEAAVLREGLQSVPLPSGGPRRSSTACCPSRRRATCRPSAGRGSGSGRAGLRKSSCT